MNHFLAMAVLLGSATLSAPATGADASHQVMTAQADMGEVDPNATASTGPADASTVMSSIEASSGTATAIQALTTARSVSIVKIKDIAKGDELPRIKQAMKDKQADITGVQAAIMANSELKAKVDAENVDMSSIVAARIAADGSVTIFVM